ncbi:hypothetical protein N7509_002956 [Penicillium cosmopolitanum]|uniref:Major facilitator superfamily (MFS) profile domain-containing protein n=1 Tax=Penicillium cosmopolitanum TaxID=1131564 RepID=A0A9W9WA81_9EURO|nr:uncharacterized protein N7509_002956 [Penicillium cosmopolitanum]KAJ5409073.1 hypothetical protein N7509_002956 [Penicillium cosmopolitanum]
MSTFFSPPDQPKEGIVLGNNAPSDTDSQSRPQSKGKASSKAASEKSTLIEEPRNSNASRTSNIRAEDTQKETANGTASTTANETAKNEEDTNKESAVKDNAEKEVKDDENKADSDADGEKSQEPEIEYPAAWRLVLITIALCFCVFCVALITDQFNSLDDVGWYGSSYLLTTCAVTLIFGKFYTYYSIKWIYLAALSVFEIGSLVCATTPTSVGLICGRAIAGLGAAGLFSGSILIIGQTVPLDKRPMYTSLIGAMFGIANVAGPLLGGAFTDRLSWRWCFYINLPIGAVTFLCIIFFLPANKALKQKGNWKQQLGEFDLLGSLFFLPSIICLLLALQWGGTKYAWDNARVIALFVVFGVLFIVFAVLQWWGQDRATVPRLPIWFQAIKGATAIKSGIMNLPMIIAVVVVSLLAGGLVTACGYYTPFMIASSIIMTIGAGLLSTLQVDSGHPKWIGYQALFGIGLGLGMQQPMMVMQTALNPMDVPSGTAIVMFSQTLGGAIFVSVGQNVFQNQLFQNLAHYAPDAPAAELISAGATMLRTLVQGDELHRVLVAYNAAIMQTFYVSVAMGALTLVGPIFVEWLSVKGKKIEMPAA